MFQLEISNAIIMQISVELKTHISFLAVEKNAFLLYPEQHSMASHGAREV